MIDIKIQGAEDFHALSKALKIAGDKGLQRELSKGITSAMKPVTLAVRNSARTTLPQRGGLAARVAATPMRTIRRAGARSASIRLQARSSYHLGQLDRGLNRHPVFGNRKVWVTQRVTPGWWTRPTDAALPVAQREVMQAMDRVVVQIDRSV